MMTRVCTRIKVFCETDGRETEILLFDVLKCSVATCNSKHRVHFGYAGCKVINIPNKIRGRQRYREYVN